MPFAEIFIPQELTDAAHAKLAETLSVIMNIEIGCPADLCKGDRLDTAPHSADLVSRRCNQEWSRASSALWTTWQFHY